MRIRLPLVLSAVICGTSLFAQENVDMTAMQRIRQEGLEHSQIPDIALHLTDANGPRLTGSPGFMRAANWAKDQLAKWGLTDAKVDPWGEFGKGWELQKSYVALTAPYYRPLIAYPKAWCSGSGGPRSGEVLLLQAADSAALMAYKGKLHGKVLLMDRTADYKMSFQPDASRYTDEQLKALENTPAPPRRNPNDTTGQAAQRARFASFRNNPAARMANILRDMAKAEGALCILSTGDKNHDGTLFTQGGGTYKAGDPENFLDIMLGLEDYMSLVRLSKAGITPRMDLDVQTKFQTADLQGYNVIGEIKGSDPKLRDEVVMLGGHLDSWHTGTGATDNAAGCMVMMEAMRILQTLHLNPKRTVRIALWSGEEEGLLGSRGYVKKTFGDPATMQLTPAHEKFSSYFNIDNGTGKIRGIYLQGNADCGPIFKQWMAPFADLGATTIAPGNTGGTDHQSFDAVGLPGFQFVQDPIEYNQRTHHSNMDVAEHLLTDDLKQIATIVAAFVYDAAQRPEKLPRKPLPEARPAGRGF